MDWMSQWLMSRWKYQFSYDHWRQASWAQPVFRWVELSGEWWELLLSNLGVKPTWLLRETGNLPLEADPRIPPNQEWIGSVAHVKMEKLVLIWSLKSSLTRFEMDNTIFGLVSAAVEQLRHEGVRVAQVNGKFAPEADPRIPPNQKKIIDQHWLAKLVSWLVDFKTWSF